MKRGVWLSLVLACITASNAYAVIIQRDILIPVEAGLNNPSGVTWGVEQFAIDPFRAETGDTFIGRIRFDRPLLMQDTGAPNPPIPDDQERFSLILDTGITTAGGVSSRQSLTLSFIDYAGDLRLPTVGTGTQSVGFGAAVSYRNNFTDSFFTFDGIDVRWIFNDITWVEPAEQFTSIWVGFDGDVVRPVIPEPTTLALMGLGLAGISFARKKQQHQKQIPL